MGDDYKTNSWDKGGQDQSQPDSTPTSTRCVQIMETLTDDFDSPYKIYNDPYLDLGFIES